MKDLQLGDIRITFDRHEIPEEFDAVVVILFCYKKLVLVWNQERGWEFPGGHREGNESYEETAVREVFEEAQAEIHDIQLLGYYDSPDGQRTILATAELSSFHGCDEAHKPSGVGVFDRLPSDLSFGDGRELLFVEHALKA